MGNEQRDEESTREQRLVEILNIVARDSNSDMLSDGLEKINSLEFDGIKVEREPHESIGKPGRNANNALLDIYQEPRREQSDGPLSDVSMVIKDNIAVRGLKMTCGLRSFSYVPRRDAVVVERILEAGGEIIGKANMDGMAFGPGGAWSEFEPVKNPRYPSCYPGGSSSGSAAAVADGTVSAALGSDTGGSVRKPAAYCGITGIKPTKGRVPGHGLAPFAPSLDTIGILARSVTIGAKILQEIAGYDPRDPCSSHVPINRYTVDDEHRSLTIGRPDTFFSCAADPIKKQVNLIIDELENMLGEKSTDISLNNRKFADIYSPIAIGEFASAVRQNGAFYGNGSWYDVEWTTAFQGLLEEGFNDHIAMRCVQGMYTNIQTKGISYIDAKQKAIEFEREVNDIFAEVDALLMPAIPRFPPTREVDLENDPHDRSINLKPFSITGHPAVVVPVEEIDGYPVSVQIVAPAFNERRALRIARRIEEMTEDSIRG